LNYPIETRPINQLKRLFLSGEKGAGHAFHVFYHLQGLFGRNIALLDGKDGKID
jgi:hypothetical protein